MRKERFAMDHAATDTLDQATLIQLADQALHAQHLSLAQRICERLYRTGSRPADAPLQQQAYDLGYRIAETKHDEIRMAELGLAALDACRSGSEEALSWHARLAKVAIASLQPDLAETHLAAMDRHQDRCDAARLPRVFLRGLWHITIGQQQAVADRLRNGSAPGLDPDHRHRLQVLAAILCSRFQEAHDLIEGHAAPKRSAAVMLLIAERRFEQAEQLLRQFAAANQGTLGHQHLQLAVNLALCQGRSAEARQLLTRLDPRSERRSLAMERARLHLLRQDYTKAALALAPIMPGGRYPVLENQLFFAHEVSAIDLARLWQASADQSGARRTPITPTTDPRPVSDMALIGPSAAMTLVRKAITTIAAAKHPVLITGETGTGKEIVARLLHQHSPAAQRPFVALNSAGMGESLAEAELFGHTKGAFTGALAASSGLIHAAEDGVLFIDEINSMPLRIQGLLLRVLESGDYRPIGGTAVRHSRCRFVFASNIDLGQAVAVGSFRQDLLYRINRLSVDIPPLRDRPEDIPSLVEHFLMQAEPEESLIIDPEVVDLFLTDSWPGNVRELRNEVERLILLRSGRKRIGISDLDLLSPSLRDRLRPLLPASHPELQVAAADHLTPVTTDSAHHHQNSSPSISWPDPRIAAPPLARKRRQQILELVAHLPQLYRADVIAQLGCSPNTATRDLLALVEAGLLRRVETSGHLRTSYFEAV